MRPYVNSGTRPLEGADYHAAASAARQGRRHPDRGTGCTRPRRRRGSQSRTRRARVDDEAVLGRAVRWRAVHMSAGRRHRRVRAPPKEDAMISCGEELLLEPPPRPAMGGGSEALPQSAARSHHSSADTHAQSRRASPLWANSLPPHLPSGRPHGSAHRPGVYGRVREGREGGRSPACQEGA